MESRILCLVLHITMRKGAWADHVRNDHGCHQDRHREDLRSQVDAFQNRFHVDKVLMSRKITAKRAGGKQHISPTKA